eukprot:1196006-Prorocentrum_minimum.AAC.7
MVNWVDRFCRTHLSLLKSPSPPPPAARATRPGSRVAPAAPCTPPCRLAWRPGAPLSALSAPPTPPAAQCQAYLKGKPAAAPPLMRAAPPSPPAPSPSPPPSSLPPAERCPPTSPSFRKPERRVGVSAETER